MYRDQIENTFTFREIKHEKLLEGNLFNSRKVNEKQIKENFHSMVNKNEYIGGHLLLCVA